MSSRATRGGVVAIAAAVLAGNLWATAGAEETVLDMYPGQSLASVLASAQPGDTVVVHPGVYPRQKLTAAFTAPVTVVGASADVEIQGINLSGGARNLVFRDLRITTTSTDTESAVKIWGGASAITLTGLTVEPRVKSGVEIQNWGAPPHDITLTSSTIVGGQRNVWVGDIVATDDTGWPARITVRGNVLRAATSDNIHISGGRDVTVESNDIRDPVENDDHNDGLQSVASTNLRVVGNRFSASGTWACLTISCVPPDQAIILGHAVPAVATKRVVNTFVANNLVAYWRGKGILVNGTDDTRIVNNTSTHNGLAGTTLAASMTIVEGGTGYTNTDLRVWNNLFDRLATGTLSVAPVYLDRNCIREGALGLADVTADPLFADLTTFMLTAESPCRDVGIHVDEWGTPTTDRVGATRDATPDAGAHEYVEPAATASTTTTEASTTTTTTTEASTTTTTPEPTTTTTEPPTTTTTEASTTTTTTTLKVRSPKLKRAISREG